MDYLVHLTTVNVFLLWLSIASLGLFLYLAFKLQKANKKLTGLTKEQNKRWQEIELKAQNDYQDIIKTANKKAEEITLKAATINNESTAKLQNTFDTLLLNQKQALETESATILKIHQEQINKLNSHILELAGNIYKDIDNNSRSDMQAFFEFIKKQTFEAEKLAQLRINEEYEKLEKDLAIRKEEKIKKLDENIYKLLSNISKDIIGKSLDFSSQQDLIIKTLEQAKKEDAL